MALFQNYDQRIGDTVRADLARKEGRSADAAELDQRIQGYREELATRP